MQFPCLAVVGKKEFQFLHELLLERFFAFFGELLEETELAQICMNFQPGKGSAMKRAFRGQA